VSGSILRNFNVFEGICGKDFCTRITLVSTMWGDVREEIGCRREQELKDDYWRDVIAAGASTARFEATFKSAWTILGNIPGGKTSASLFIRHH